jgi:hypothetical protein
MKFEDGELYADGRIISSAMTASKPKSGEVVYGRS